MSWNPNIALTLYQSFNSYPIKEPEVKSSHEAEKFVSEAQKQFKQARQALRQYNPNRVNKNQYLLIETIDESAMRERAEKIRKIQASMNILATHLSTTAQKFGLAEKVELAQKQIAALNYTCIIYLEQYNHFLKERTLQDN